METLLILGLAALTLEGIAVAAMALWMRRAPWGFEDAAGFHLGKRPTRATDPVPHVWRPCFGRPPRYR